MSLLSVVFRVLDKAGAAFIEPRREDGHGSAANNRSFVRDDYSGGQILADQTAGASALTFTFSSPVNLIYVQIKTGLGTGSGRVNPLGGVATASSGIPCDDGVPMAIPVTSSSVSVFATTGATVSVWGFRY